MYRQTLVAFVILFSVPSGLFGQTVALGGAANVASAEDFATRVLQDPWDMNERTDFGAFLDGSDSPLPDLTNVSFSGGVFSATTGTSPNVFLLETRNPNAATLGKTGANFPIDANTYRLLAVRMNASGSGYGVLAWNRDNLWDPTFTYTKNVNFPVAPGWRTYLLDIPALGIQAGSLTWSGVLKSLQFYLPTGVSLQIDWIRLVNINASLCRQVTWSGLGAGAVDLYLDVDGVTNENEWVLATNVAGNTASAGCTANGSGYNFYAGALAPGTYYVVARPAGTTTGPVAHSTTAYVVNDAPLLTITAPSDEGSADDFATTQLGNAWDMNASTDVDQFFNVTGPTFNTPIAAETPAGVSLGNVPVLWAQSVAAAPPAGDPIVVPLWQRGVSNPIDPLRYRILTVEFGLPNIARSVVGGSIARIVWRVVGDTDSVSDDIIFNSRLGANVMNKITLDMADRALLPIEQGSTTGWVRGGTGQGIDHFRFDPHEFPAATAFFIRRIKLAALEHVPLGGSYTIRWSASKNSGAVTLYYDTDRDPTTGLTLIGQVSTSAGSFLWTPSNVPTGEYYIYAVIGDGQGNFNSTYTRWPIVVDPAPPPPPVNFRIIG